MIEYLKKFRTEPPRWLMEHQPGGRLPMGETLRERIVFYPGSKFDGQPIRTFNTAHSAFVFLYADYRRERKSLLKEFRERGLRGYRILDAYDLPMEELISMKDYVDPGHLSRKESCCQVLLFREGNPAPPWKGYRLIPGLKPELGGTHCHERYLFARSEDGCRRRDMEPEERKAAFEKWLRLRDHPGIDRFIRSMEKSCSDSKVRDLIREVTEDPTINNIYEVYDPDTADRIHEEIYARRAEFDTDYDGLAVAMYHYLKFVSNVPYPDIRRSYMYQEGKY